MAHQVVQPGEQQVRLLAQRPGEAAGAGLERLQLASHRARFRGLDGAHRCDIAHRPVTLGVVLGQRFHSGILPILICWPRAGGRRAAAETIEQTDRHTKSGKARLAVTQDPSARSVGPLAALPASPWGSCWCSSTRQSTEAQVGRAEAVVARACDLIRDRYDFYVVGLVRAGAGAVRPAAARRPRHRRRARAGAPGRRGRRHLAGRRPARSPMPIPTYEGTGPKTDLPAAERDQIQAVNRQAARDEQPVDRRIDVADADTAAACLPARRPDRRPDRLDHDPGAGGAGLPAAAARPRRPARADGADVGLARPDAPGLGAARARHRGGPRRRRAGRECRPCDAPASANSTASSTR